MKKLNQWITSIAGLIQQDKDIDPESYAYFIANPEYSIQVIDIFAGLNEKRVDANPSRYTACLFVLDICVAKLQTAYESGSKLADKVLSQLMSHLAMAIQENRHSLSFWLPVLNAFYEAHVDLSAQLKDAYFNLANQDSDEVPDHEFAHLSSIRDLIEELSDLSAFEVAENFFAQSYAMPPDFFIDLVLDLYHIDSGHDIALLTLMHPNPEVREVVVATLDSLMDTISLSPISLSRLQMIQHWYPAEYQGQFNHWIKLQRKKGVVFHREPPAKIVHLKASEIDGGGAQGVFIHFRKQRKNRLCGLLFKLGVGIKDAWTTPVIAADQVQHYYRETFDDSVTLRSMNLAYLELMIQHFLALSIEKSLMPNLHFLEILEELGLHILPQAIDPQDLLQQLGAQISPVSPQVITQSLERSKHWFKTSAIAESWYIENAAIDKVVNQCSGFADGVKVCELDQAMVLVFEEFERHRPAWVFHFLWVCLWLQMGTRPNPQMWRDCFFIGYVIDSGQSLKSIPLMEEICRRTVLNSIDTMQERQTHLS